MGLQQNYKQDPQISQLTTQFQQGALDQQLYQLKDELLFYKKRLHLGTLKTQQQQILQQFHNSPTRGHTGTQKTYARIKKEFY